MLDKMKNMFKGKAKDKTTPKYWSCRLPRYAKLLGLKSNFSGFW